jgi:hypothetical protein
MGAQSLSGQGTCQGADSYAQDQIRGGKCPVPAGQPHEALGHNVSRIVIFLSVYATHNPSALVKSTPEAHVVKDAGIQTIE